MNVLYLALMASASMAGVVSDFLRPPAVTPVDEVAAVRRQSEAYAAALLKCDKVTLFGMLHGDYQGENMMWGERGRSPQDKTSAIVFWNEPHKLIMTFDRVTRLEYTVRGVRVFGDTAIETGVVSAWVGDHACDGVNYSRVWLKNEKQWHGWQLVHERY